MSAPPALLPRDDPPRTDRVADHRVSEVVVLLRAAVRAVQLYPADNAAVLSAVAELGAACKRIEDADRLFELRSAGDHLFVNDRRLRLGGDTLAAAGTVLVLLREAGVGTIALQARPSPGEWVRFLAALADPPAGAEADRLTRLRARLHEAGVQAFVLGPPNSEEDDAPDADDRERSRQRYLRTVTVTRSIFRAARLGRAVGVRQSRRVLRGLVDEILQNEASMLGLTALRDFDEYTFVHSVNVSILAVALGRRLGLPKPQLLELGLAALLHDVGKSQVPLDVLNKPGRLTEEEFALVREHTWRGALALVRTPTGSAKPWRAMAVAFEHHLRVDLAGYPRTRRARDLSLFTRIVAVADGFDAATSKRVYQDVPWSPADVLRGMQDASRHGLDPVLVKVFAQMMGTYPVGTVVVLDSGEVGVVMAANPAPEFCARPKVRLVLDPSGRRVDGVVVLDLSDRHAGAGFLRSVVRCDAPERFGIVVSDYTG